MDCLIHFSLFKKCYYQLFKHSIVNVRLLELIGVAVAVKKWLLPSCLCSSNMWYYIKQMLRKQLTCSRLIWYCFSRNFICNHYLIVFLLKALEFYRPLWAKIQTVLQHIFKKQYNKDKNRVMRPDLIVLISKNCLDIHECSNGLHYMYAFMLGGFRWHANLDKS